MDETRESVRLWFALPRLHDGEVIPLSRDLCYHVEIGIPAANALPAPELLPQHMGEHATIPNIAKQTNLDGSAPEGVDPEPTEGQVKEVDTDVVPKDKGKDKELNAALMPDEIASRPYVPISTPADDLRTGEVQFVVKKYQGGQVTPTLCQLEVDASVNVRGPFPAFDVAGLRGRTAQQVGLLAAGTGITPMIQVAHFFLNPHMHATVAGSRLDRSTWCGPESGTLRLPAQKVTLVLFARSLDDVNCRNELETFTADHPETFSYTVVTSESPERARMHDFLQSQLPAPHPNSLVTVCGPDRFLSDICGSANTGMKGTLLGGLGFEEGHVHRF